MSNDIYDFLSDFENQYSAEHPQEASKAPAADTSYPMTRAEAEAMGYKPSSIQRRRSSPASTATPATTAATATKLRPGRRSGLSTLHSHHFFTFSFFVVNKCGA